MEFFLGETASQTAAGVGTPMEHVRFLDFVSDRSTAGPVFYAFAQIPSVFFCGTI